MAPHRLLHTPFFRFLAVGGFAAAVNVILRYLLDPFVGFNLAIVLAYLVAMTIAFGLNKTLVFAASGEQTHIEFLRFGIVNAAAIFQVWAVSVMLAIWVLPMLGLDTHRHEIAHIVGVAVPAVTSYYGHKYFSFALVSRVPARDIVLPRSEAR